MTPAAWVLIAGLGISRSSSAPVRRSKSDTPDYHSGCWWSMRCTTCRRRPIRILPLPGSSPRPRANRRAPGCPTARAQGAHARDRVRPARLGGGGLLPPPGAGGAGGAAGDLRALDGEARWRDEEGREVGPHRLAAGYREETTRPALFAALRAGFAERCCGKPHWPFAVSARASAGPWPGQTAGGGAGPGVARHYYALLQGRAAFPSRDSSAARRLGHARGARDPAAFRLRSERSILVTVAIADEELDAPEVAVVAALIHIGPAPGTSRWSPGSHGSIRTPAPMACSGPWCSTLTIPCLRSSVAGLSSSKET
jgi:hypothetical protein